MKIAACDFCAAEQQRVQLAVWNLRVRKGQYQALTVHVCSEHKDRKFSRSAPDHYYEAAMKLIGDAAVFFDSEQNRQAPRKKALA